MCNGTALSKDETGFTFCQLQGSFSSFRKKVLEKNIERLYLNDFSKKKKLLLFLPSLVIFIAIEDVCQQNVIMVAL